MTITRISIALALGALLTACGGGETKDPETATEGSPQTAPASQPAASQPASQPTPLPGTGIKAPVNPGGFAAGTPCKTASECESGICEGEGCDGKGPVCAASGRMCTKDLRPYCGCDSKTFRTSGSCPGRPYAHRGECKE
ncbi:MAG: hypothetical protein ACE366_07785 [Bradymonadia bacterium]